MAPITKKSKQNARTRVLRPSSFMAEIAMVLEWGAAIDVTFLFRKPSSSCDEEELETNCSVHTITPVYCIHINVDSELQIKKQNGSVFWESGTSRSS